jgi:predicted ATPase
MEKLKRIRVAGFRSFRDVQVEFGDVAVLIGANGSGKSNFISFFEMLHAILDDRFQVYVARRGGGSAILHYGPKETVNLTAELTFATEKSGSKYYNVLTFASPDRLVIAHESIKAYWKPTETLSVPISSWSGQQETTLFADVQRQQHPEQREVALRVIDQLKAVQVYHFHDTSETANIRLMQDIDRNRELLRDAGNLASFLYMLQQTKPHHFDRILRTIQLVVPYLHKLILEPSLLNPQKISLRWSDKAGEYEFSPHQLSDGSLRAMAIITALLQPEELLPSVIIMDEPELGLHPSAIGIIASLVREVSSKRQVIIATQSPGFLAHFSPEEVIVVERREDNRGFGESTCKRLSKEDLSAWLEEFNLGELYERNVTGGWPQ